MADIRTRVAEALRRNWQRREQEQWIYGLLGRYNASSSTTDFAVKGRKNFLYVTIRNAAGSQTSVPARNDAGVPQTENLPVKIRLEYGVYVIHGQSGKADEGVVVEAPPTGVLPHSLDNHTDVTISSPVTNEVLKYNGSQWVNDIGGGAVDSVNGHTGVVVLDPDDLDDTATTNKFITAAEITKLSGIEPLADVTDAGNVGAAIHGASAKATPVDADTMPLIDSAASNVLKKVTWANIKATLKTYFDTLYATAANITTAINNLLASNNTWTGTNDFERNVSIEPTNTTGNSLAVLRDLAAASTNAPMVAFVQDNAGDDQAALIAQQDGTGDIISLYDGATEVFDVKDGGSVTITQIGISNNALKVIRDLAAASTAAALVDFIQDNAGDDQAALRVQQDGTGPILSLFDGATEVVRFADGGLTGFGVDVPEAQVHTVSNSLSASRGVLSAQHSTDIGAALILMRKSRGTGGSPTTVVNGDFIGAFGFQVYDGTAYRQTAAIAARSNGAVASNSIPTDLIFATGSNNDSSLLNERMRIISDGQVAIGLSSPGASGLLAVKAGSSNNDAAVGGVLYVITTQGNNSGTGETTLASYSLPTNTLSVNNQSVHVRASGTVTSGNTLRFKFGATTIVDLIAGGTLDWEFEGHIYRTSATTQKCWGRFRLSGPSYFGHINYVTASENLASGTPAISITGQGTSSSQVSCEVFSVKFEEANT